MVQTRPPQVPDAPQRPDDAHKGTFGTVCVVGGSATMIGAPALAATAALRGGCGLCRIVTGAELIGHCLAIEPSATGVELAGNADRAAVDGFIESLDDKCVLAVGPGMGVGADQQVKVTALLDQARPMVLDADGLNNLAATWGEVDGIGCALVVTPHPGEYQRLAGAMGIDGDAVDAAVRPDAAAALARELSAVVVLKGMHTVVSDGERQYLNGTGNAALATAGSGDVLTGLIASLMAQGMAGFDAAVLGVYLHGRAADVWARAHGRSGLTARDLAGLIPDVMEAHRCGK